ncbi:hypothetical protein [Arcobacter aquimarinus]|uniref:Uncharacterized protein n=1 Tax=Arcobacter aquimarinus TaxID=1315211 RepID=A0AAE7B5U0_9BACT|nr:hypothetical protein [Arcobacter aquimarinus]QKE26195.1 hypothetical protein AAQM_1448 [Arcobacter aquimarinus]RXI35805.1 hypothetical protein CP986_05335 [Arcobacter aquimarinus]
MIEELFEILKENSNNFNLQCKKGKYRLVLDEVVVFTGDTVEEVLNQAVDWFDINETNSFLDSDISLAKEIHKKEMNEGFKDYAGNDSNKKLAVNYKAFGYSSDGRE